MWKNYISKISPEYHFKTPATKYEQDEINAKLNVELPTELKNLFSETNGVFDEFNCPLIWSTKQIIEENLSLRNDEEFKDLFMPFDHLLFFSDAGNGDLFGYAILNGEIQKDDVYVWSHECDSRTWIASSLEDFIEGWATGRIGV
ncbi:SMI1/KNR4 family protein [Neobacillus sp. NPDC058068]|uniref:SMI1/KNR4 family protein n=1 Tax=Neobacillus sp. NPDC058068 TaxID=3346325 RepID=UPI0036D7BDDC